MNFNRNLYTVMTAFLSYMFIGGILSDMLCNVYLLKSVKSVKIVMQLFNVRKMSPLLDPRRMDLKRSLATAAVWSVDQRNH